MSSTYYTVCLSHDPGVRFGPDFHNDGEATAYVADGEPSHPSCDVVIIRASYPPVEIGCPPARHRKDGPRCGHQDVEWMPVKWLRLLAHHYAATEGAVAGNFGCWTRARMDRLRDELGTADR